MTLFIFFFFFFKYLKFILKDGDHPINSESNGFEIDGPCFEGDCRMNMDTCAVNDDDKDCVASPWKSKKSNILFHLKRFKVVII